MNRREFIKVGAASTIGAIGLAGCTREDSEGVAASDETVELRSDGHHTRYTEEDAKADIPDSTDKSAFEKGSPQNPWTEEEVQTFMAEEGDLGPSPNLHDFVEGSR